MGNQGNLVAEQDKMLFDDWKIYEDLERFSIGIYSFNIEKAKGILMNEPRYSDVMEIDGLKGLVNFIKSHPSDREIDFSVPIIVGQWKLSDGELQVLPIDGWARIREALGKGLKSLPCVVLTKSETKTIMSM